MKTLIALLLLALPAFSNGSETETVVRRGEAFSPKTGRLLWLEEHREVWVDGRPEKAEVVYSSPDAKPFARKTLTFGRLRGTPDFRLEDARDGYVEGAETSGKGIRLFCRRKTGQPIEAEVHRSESDLVADAGAEEFIRSNWDRLVGGEKLEFRFAVPFERDFFRFHVRKIDAGKRTAGRSSASG